MISNEFAYWRLNLDVPLTLTIFSERLQGLIDESHVTLVDVKPQQSQAPSGGAANTVQKHQRFRHQVVVWFVVLITEKILEMEM